MKQPKLSDLKVDTRGTKQIRRMMAKSKKIKITVNVDEDILTSLKKMAEQSGAPYQSLLNKLLRESLVEKQQDGSRLDRLEREIEKLKRKLTA